MFQDPILFDASRALQTGMVEAIAEPRIPPASHARIVGG